MDTIITSSRMLLCILGAMAEFDRSLIHERIIAGHNRAKVKGIKMGRPSKINCG